MRAATSNMDNLQPNAGYVESVLQRYGVQKITRTGDGFMACCPFHDDKNPSFSISDTGLWLCFACSEKGNMYQFHERLGGGKMDWQETLRAMGAQLGALPYIKKSQPKRSVAYEPLPKGFKAYESVGGVPPYISNRLKWDTILQFGLGACPVPPNSGRCVIPIQLAGKVVGYHSRALDLEIEPRYYNPKGFEIKDHVFNLDSCKKGGEVIVVEGAFNAMSMWEKGFPNTAAVFGTKFTPRQIGRIFSISPSSVVICFDRDPSKIGPDGKDHGRAGQKAAKKFGEAIHEFIPTFVMALPLGLDPNELTADILTACYKKKVSYEKLFR